jgi:5-methylcytosine-specific restriction endonuclease McrA
MMTHPRTEDSGGTASKYRKRNVPNAVRREVARRYGAEPGTTVLVPCHYCGVLAKIVWLSYDLSWPIFYHELDHVIPQFHGGPSTAANIVLACQSCNRRKGHTRTRPTG